MGNWNWVVCLEYVGILWCDFIEVGDVCEIVLGWSWWGGDGCFGSGVCYWGVGRNGN